MKLTFLGTRLSGILVRMSSLYLCKKTQRKKPENKQQHGD